MYMLVDCSISLLADRVSDYKVALIATVVQAVFLSFKRLDVQFRADA
jgi:hypothetical protein